MQALLGSSVLGRSDAATMLLKRCSGEREAGTAECYHAVHVWVMFIILLHWDKQAPLMCEAQKCPESPVSLFSESASDQGKADHIVWSTPGMCGDVWPGT